MKEDFYLKKIEILGLKSKPLVVSAKCEKGITNLYEIAFPEEYFFVYPDFLISFKKFLMTGETCHFRELPLRNDILELQIIIGKESSKKVSVYSIILEKIENNFNVISECLSIEGRVEIFRDQWEGMVCKDEILEEELIQDLKTSKNNCLWKSIIISNFMSTVVYPEVSHIVKRIAILDLNYYIGEITGRDQYEILEWIDTHFSKKVQNKTKELLCKCFPDINGITEDFKIEERGIELDIREQGSGFITCFALFLHLYKMIIYKENGTVFLIDPLNSLHPILKRVVLEYFNKALKETGGQLLLFAD